MQLHVSCVILVLVLFFVIVPGTTTQPLDNLGEVTKPRPSPSTRPTTPRPQYIITPKNLRKLIALIKNLFSKYKLYVLDFPDFSFRARLEFLKYLVKVHKNKITKLNPPKVSIQVIGHRIRFLTSYKDVKLAGKWLIRAPILIRNGTYKGDVSSISLQVYYDIKKRKMTCNSWMGRYVVDHETLDQFISRIFNMRTSRIRMVSRTEKMLTKAFCEAHLNALESEEEQIHSYISPIKRNK